MRVPLVVAVVGDRAAAASELHEREHRLRSHRQEHRLRPRRERLGPFEVAALAGDRRESELGGEAPPLLPGLRREPRGFLARRHGERRLGEVNGRPRL